jgi:hypothetical protein
MNKDKALWQRLASVYQVNQDGHPIGTMPLCQEAAWAIRWMEKELDVVSHQYKEAIQRLGETLRREDRFRQFVLRLEKEVKELREERDLLIRAFAAEQERERRDGHDH